MPEPKSPLKFQAQILDIYNQPQHDLAASAEKISKSKPRFCMLLLLALVGKRNDNKHRLPLEHTENAIAALGDKPHIPADLNHRTAAKGVSTNIWIEKGGDYPRLMMEALFWSRYFTEEEIKNIKAEHKKRKLAASWEIDAPYYELVAAEDIPDTLDVINFDLSGFALIVGIEPAESATKGEVIITASKGGDDLDDKEFWALYGMILDEDRDIMAALQEEEPDQEFLERFFYELDNDGLEAKRLTYQERKDLPDSAFAYVKTVKGKSGKELKVRRFPIHDEAHRINCVQRLPQAKGLEASEKAAIFRKCLARGRSAGDKWADDYKGWDTSVYPPKQPAKADLESGSKVMEAWPGDDFMSFLRGIRCPECGERYGRVRRADLDKGKFLIECGGNNPDREEHDFWVTIVVEPTGKAASYALVAKDGSVENIELVFQTIKEVSKMADAVFTQDQKVELVSMIDASVKKAFADQKESAQAQTKDAEDRQKAIDDAVAARLKDEKDRAVKADREKRKVGASRSDIIAAIKPFESAEVREEAIQLFADMSQEDFEAYKKDLEKDRKIADLEAKLKGEGEGSGDGEGDKPGDKPGDNKDGDKPKPTELTDAQRAKLYNRF